MTETEETAEKSTDDKIAEHAKALDEHRKAITDQCAKEVQAVLEKYGCSMQVSSTIFMQYTPSQGK